MVPADAADIRDSGGASFARLETLRFRSRALEIAAFALVALGLIVGAPAVRALVHRARPASRVQDEVVPRQIALRTADAELARVERDARAGWTPELVGRCLIALRIAGAAALARPVAHHGDGGGRADDGRLVASVGRLRRRQVEISSALTPLEIQAAIAALPATVTATRREALEDLQRVMQVFTAALYGTAALDAATLDEAVASARRAAERAVSRR
jgi:hypothetical protein